MPRRIEPYLLYKRQLSISKQYCRAQLTSRPKSNVLYSTVHTGYAARTGLARSVGTTHLMTRMGTLDNYKFMPNHTVVKRGPFNIENAHGVRHRSRIALARKYTNDLLSHQSTRDAHGTSSYATTVQHDLCLQNTSAMSTLRHVPRHAPGTTSCFQPFLLRSSTNRVRRCKPQ